MLRTIFVKPENAINIPEKYKIKIENMNKKLAEEKNQNATLNNRKQPIRIRPSTSKPVTEKTVQIDSTTVTPKKAELTIDLTEDVGATLL